MNKPMSVNDTMVKYRRNFYKVYHSTIAPVFRQFEKKRKDMLVTLCLICAILLTIVASTGIGMFTGQILNQPSKILCVMEELIGFVALICLIWLPIHFNNKFVDELKKTCMGKIISLFGNVTWHNKTALISDTEMAKSYLFRHYNTRESFDAFSGSYNGVNFEICETTIGDEASSSDEHGSVYKWNAILPLFKGVVIKFNSNKNANGVTMVASKKDAYTGINKLGFIGFGCFLFSLFQIIFPIIYKDIFKFDIVLFGISFLGFVILIILIKTGVEAKNAMPIAEMKLEDPEFNKKYRAYSNDQVQGRYLITSAFMERFQNLQTTFGTEKVKCSFYGNTLMFAISTDKNLFEIGGLFRSLENPKQLDKFFDELISIYLMIDYFKLDEDTKL